MLGEPRQFGPYWLIRRLGVGGMAETFEAERRGSSGFDQRVCLKRVLPAFGEDEELAARFQREAILAARLRHTHIVGVVDAGTVRGAPYMALELVDGLDLRSLLKSSPGEKLDPEIVTLIAIDLAYALDHAHGTLVHRDVSPSNILLSRSGEAKLADFGIAKALDAAKGTASRSAKGKIPYMAPEQMRGERVDGRADLFSLGVVMFEALSGRRPFDAPHDVGTMRRILDGNRLSLEDVAPEVPAGLAEVVDRLIVVDREARFQSVSELLDALAELAPSPTARRSLAETIEAHRGGPQARLHVRAREEDRDTELTKLPAPDPPKAPRRRKRATLAGALVLMGAALALVSVSAPVPAPVPASAPVPAPAAVSVPAAAAAAAPVSVPEAVSVPAAAAVSAPVSASASDPVAVPEPENRVTNRPAWLRIVVQPWGNVWVDGDYMGRAPVLARLSPGRHTIAAGHELPRQKRVVRVQPGARKEIVVSLDEE